MCTNSYMRIVDVYGVWNGRDGDGGQSRSACGAGAAMCGGRAQEGMDTRQQRRLAELGGRTLGEEGLMDET